MDRGLGKDDIAARLELELLSGHLPAGSKLQSERQLAERFGVSRPMVREVLRTLEERGLIEVRAGRGAYVRAAGPAVSVRPFDTAYRQRKPTPRHLVQARMMLERETARLAAEHATEADLAAMRAALDRCDQARDVVSKARADLDFHAAVARASRNPVIETMFDSISPLVFELMLRSLSDPAISREGLPYHDLVLRAIEDGDPTAARAAMERHLDLALTLFGNDLDQSLDLLAQRRIEQLLALTDSVELKQ
ncbi:FadR/GntR family transcriptional regulator [Nonomuraea basaltis]|uniref:FadR/GntR family transcriptional regulator n=1 Tax=Nonomuraea basaltis TaxID=2495887 RepID=UPI00110C459F|nr:FadR/GntR family transcriptional regulator [Nonomuraea basaltis]TMR99909.1 FadR family transcriptional regulator [Nonomuraea basaltis]